MIVWGFCKLFHERVILTGVSTMIIQNIYLMSRDGHNSARSMKSREETNRNCPGSVSLGCLNLLPALSQCCWLQQFWWNTFSSMGWTKPGIFPPWALSRGWQESRAWDVPGVGFALSKPHAGVALCSAPLAMAISPLLPPLRVQTPRSIPPGGSVP